MFEFKNTAILEPSPPVDTVALKQVSETLLRDHGIRYLFNSAPDEFSISPKHSVSFQRNSFWPIVHGRMVTSSNSSRLELSGHAVRFVRVFMTIYMAFALFFMLVCITLLAKNQLASIVPLLISAILLLGGYGLTDTMTRWCFRKIVHAFEQSQ